MVIGLSSCSILVKRKGLRKEVFMYNSIYKGDFFPPTKDSMINANTSCFTNFYYLNNFVLAITSQNSSNDGIVSKKYYHDVYFYKKSGQVGMKYLGFVNSNSILLVDSSITKRPFKIRRIDSIMFETFSTQTIAYGDTSRYRIHTIFRGVKKSSAIVFYLGGILSGGGTEINLSKKHNSFQTSLCPLIDSMYGQHFYQGQQKVVEGYSIFDGNYRYDKIGYNFQLKKASFSKSERDIILKVFEVVDKSKLY